MAMAEEQNVLTSRLELARSLVGELESGRLEEAELIIHRLSAPFERELFEELGKLTRELHEALKSFRGDERLVALTRDDIPDAKERLNYVVTMTEQATHRTLGAVEEGLPLAERLHASATDLGERWTRFRKRDLSIDEFRLLATALDEFFAGGRADTERLRALMSDIMMAQDFQDLTGQIIRRVIRLVQEVEENLVGLIRLSSERMEPRLVGRVPAETAPVPSAEASRGPTVPNTRDTQVEVVSGQDEVDDLLSSLGF